MGGRRKPKRNIDGYTLRPSLEVVSDAFLFFYDGKKAGGDYFK
jgi:hypothetical protein